MLAGRLAAPRIPAIGRRFYIRFDPGGTFSGGLIHSAFSLALQKVAKDKKLIGDFRHRAGTKPVAFMLVIKAKFILCRVAIPGDEPGFVIDESVFQDMVQQQYRFFRKGGVSVVPCKHI